MKKLLHLLKVVAINLVTFIVLLALLNWICGLTFSNSAQNRRDQLPNYQDNRDYAQNIFKDYYAVQHQYEPFVGWKTLPYTGNTLHISAQGERVHTPPAFTGTQPRVRFFGGSTMWGEGSDDQHTIPALFNQALPQYRVTNHGQLAYNSRQELDALLSITSRNDSSDIVVFYDGVNDAAFLCPTEITQLPAHRLVPLFRQKLYVSKSAFVKEMLYKAFLENTLKLTARFSKAPKASPYNCISDPNKAEEIAEIMMRNWEIAHDVVTRQGGRFIAILQPAAFISNPRTDHLTLDPELGKNFAAVYQRIQAKIAERQHDWIYDLSNRFDGNEYIFIDFCHVSANGNQIIANEIAKIVQQQPTP